MPAEILRASSSLLTHVAEPAARSIVLGCCAAMALGALRVKNVAARLLVWRGVLVGALAMPLLALLALPVTVRVPAPVANFAKHVAATATPAPSAEETSAVASKSVSSAALVEAGTPTNSVAHSVNLQARGTRKGHAKQFVAATAGPMQVELTSAPTEVATAHTRTPIRGAIPWVLLAAGIYLAIVFVFLVRMWLGIRIATKLERSAIAVKDARALDAAVSAARTNGITSVPRLAESEMLSVPVTLGVRNPAILFPVEWKEWEEGELEAVLAHEISHVARRDALVQRLALIHRAIFWFSPFAWWLERHLVDLSEQASDEAALAGGADRTRYAETLLGFFATLEDAPQRVWWQGVSMAQLGQAEKRVDRILAWSGAMSKRLSRSLMVGLIAVAAPVVLLTASVHPTVNNFQEPVVDPEPQATTPPAQRPASVPAQASTAPVAAPAMPPVPPDADLDSMPPPVAGVPVTPMAAVAPMAPAALQGGLLTPPAIAGNSDEVAQAYEAVRQAQEELARAKEEVAATQAQAAKASTKAELEEIKEAKSAYKEAMASYKENLKRYYACLAEAREIAAVAPALEGVNGGIYGGVSGGVGGQRIYRESIGSGNEQYRIAESYSGDWGPRFVIVTKGSGDVTMSGTEEDADHARSLRNKISGDFIWFERDEKSYVITDPDFISKAKALFAPQEELSRKQDELGRQQDELGKQQDALGKKMDGVKVKIPDITPDLERVRSELDALRQQDGVSQRELGRLQSELARMQSEIGRFQSDAGRQQGDIGRQQGDLGRKQGELGRQQGELGRQQGELARKASLELREMFSTAIDKGVAKPE